MSWPCDCLVYWKIKNRNMPVYKENGLLEGGGWEGKSFIYCAMVAQARLWIGVTDA